MVRRLDLYSARLTFDRNEEEVTVHLRKSKKDNIKKVSFPIPERIRLNELDWERFRKKTVSRYYRDTNEEGYVYRDSEKTPVPTSLGQRLERIVAKACEKLHLN